MTKTRKPTDPRPNLGAVKAFLDVLTGGDGTVEIAHPVTLPGRPVTVQLGAGEVCDYLLATGWKETTETALRGRKFRKLVPSAAVATIVRILPDGSPGVARVLCEEVHRIADAEQRHPLDVAEAIIARRAGNGKPEPEVNDREAWERDAEDALLLAEATTPDWGMGGVDAGDGRSIVADGKIPMEHIRVSTPVAGGAKGSRSITPKQRDADARFIVAARTGWPRDAARVRELLTERCGKRKRAVRKG